ncbi:futalosine hydrolase [Mucilaginibacter ginsenosidivorax]|uniref:Futalosine hydrolase n=1 Tax=Mucilaginibacter ginsenosidivorax TaxID=862126 RepID=A0A5B8VZ49_9SPHI|nr:futalosine hydrolase [Mucilaginibacter ginsenosidivorax]QEC76940.1 futalosine hydrolase [Mucilaginibacter ginsenosidivorax]
MLILVVAATAPEVEPLAKYFGNKIDVLITGAGMVPTAFALGRLFAHNKYDLVINLGIAGSFDKSIEPGFVVEVTDDTFAETGAEDDEKFIPMNVLGFGEVTYKPTTSLDEVESNFYLKKARAITVNTVHGNDTSIKKVQERLNPQLESMEGAAFFYACRQVNARCIQIRAVSNFVEKRNRDNWQIGLAIKNLNTFAIDLIDAIIKL